MGSKWLTLLLVYIVVSAADVNDANRWCQQNVDPQGGLNTFVVNKQDDNGGQWALISIVDHGDYAEKMKAKFGTIENPSATLHEIAGGQGQ